MKRFLILWSFLALVFLLTFSGCDSSSNNSNDNNTNIATPVTVQGTVQASYLKGVKVCIDDKCDITNENGVFKIEDVYLPATLTLFIGNRILSEVEITNQDDFENLKISPMFLAKDNKTLAEYLGAFLHGVGMCSLNAEKCDLSNVKEIMVGDDNETNNWENRRIVDSLRKVLLKCDNIHFRVSIKDKDGKDCIHNNTIDKQQADLYANHCGCGDNESNNNDINEQNDNNSNDNNTNDNSIHTGSDNVSFIGLAGYNIAISGKYDKGNHKLYLSTNNKQWSVELKNVYNNIVFKDSNDNLYFISPTLIAAPYIDEYGEKYISFLFKDYGINNTYNNMQQGDYLLLPDLSNLKLSKSIDKFIGNWEISDSYDGLNYKGEWELSYDLKKVIVIRSDGQVKDYNITMIPDIENGRSAFIMENVDRDGYFTFKVGIYRKPMTINELIGTYDTYRINEFDDVCYGKVFITKDKKFKYNDIWCEGGNESSYTGNLLFDAKDKFGEGFYDSKGMALVMSEGNLYHLAYIDGNLVVSDLADNNELKIKILFGVKR